MEFFPFNSIFLLAVRVTMKGMNGSKFNINQKVRSEFSLGARGIRTYESICFRSGSCFLCTKQKLCQHADDVVK